MLWGVGLVPDWCQTGSGAALWLPSSCDLGASSSGARQDGTGQALQDALPGDTPACLQEYGQVVLNHRLNK